MDIEQLSRFLAWSTAINFGLLVLATIGLWLLRDLAERVHGTLFGLPRVALGEQYFQYLAQYKLLILVFNFVPWLALQLI